MTEKYLIMVSVYLFLMLLASWFKTKRLSRELDKTNLKAGRLNKELFAAKRRVEMVENMYNQPMFREDYDVKTVGYQAEIDDREYRRMNLPAEVLEMEQEKRAIYEIVEEIQRVGGISKFEEGASPYTPNRRVNYELKFLLKK